jgi:DNA-binding IclR family transcriptional regulator
LERAYNDLKSVSRAAEVLTAFLKAEEWSISGLARELSLHKSVTHRLVSTLTTAGLLICDARSGLYRLGPIMAQLGEKVERNGLLHRLARPYMVELARLSGETVSMQVVQGDHGLCVDVVESQQAMRLTISPGQSFPLHAGCAGKVMLAYQSPAFIDRLLSRTPLQRYTDWTITDADALRADLAQIRRRGFGYSDGEITPGARSVGAPIFEANGVVAGSLVISGPSIRLSQERLNQLALPTTEAAAGLSVALGHTPQPTEGGRDALQQKAG